MLENVNRTIPVYVRPIKRYKSRILYTFNERKSYLVSLLFPGFYVFPSSISFGALNIIGAAILLVGAAAIRELYHKITNGRFVLVLSDITVLAMTVWMIAALCMNIGLSAIVGAGSFSALQFLFTYLTCRVFFSNPATFEIFVDRMVYVVGVVLVYAILDILTGRNIVSSFGYMISQGTPSHVLAAEAYRFGLVRAEGSIEHPILMGIFFVISGILFCHSRMTWMRKSVALSICGAGIVLALSSSPIISVGLASGMILYFNVLSTKPWAKLLLFGVFGYAIALILLTVEQPIHALIKTFTLDPQTGLYRMEIWRWAAVNVRLSPWTGIGNRDWIRGAEMSATIDSLWLVQSIRYGLPATALLILTAMTTGVALSLHKKPREPARALSTLSLGLGIAIFVLVFNGFTVHFWGTVWFYLAAVLGMRAGLTEAAILSKGWTSVGAEPYPLKTKKYRNGARVRLHNPAHTG